MRQFASARYPWCACNQDRPPENDGRTGRRGAAALRNILGQGGALVLASDFRAGAERTDHQYALRAHRLGTLDYLRRAAHRELRPWRDLHAGRSEEHTSELQSLMRISYAVFCLKKKKHT